MGGTVAEGRGNKVLVLGATGMAGHKILGRLGELDHVVTGAARTPGSPDLAPYIGGATILGGLDAQDPRGLDDLLDRVAPDVVVNAVGLIKQRIEAFDPLWAIPVNALFPHVVAAACRARGMRLVHLSTDCVFGGNRGGYREDDTPDAMNLYGRSKLLGEVVGPGAVTLRLSIIGPELRGHLGLLDWILSNRGRVVQGFRDVFFSGLTTLELTHVIDLAIRDRRTRNGLWHVAAQPIDKDSLLRLVDAAFGLGLTIQSVDKGRLDRSLNADRFMDATGWRAPDWPTMVTAMAEDWRARGYPFPPRRQ